MKRLLCFAVFLIGMTQVSIGQEGTASTFYSTCVGIPKDSAENVICDLHIRSLALGFWMAQSMQERGMRSCLPESINPVKGRLIVEKFMRENPDKLHLPTQVVIMSALLRAFPCKK